MTVTAALVGGLSPQLVQVVISATPSGQAWTLKGTTGSGYTWQVPGGEGNGDGNQLVLTDNRTPGNVAITYVLSSSAGTESSAPITVPFAKDFVLQSVDGQRALAVDLLADSLDYSLTPTVATFRVPGRARPVIRYDVMGDADGVLKILLDASDTAAFRALIRNGAPLLCRFGTTPMDLDLVSTVALTAVTSTAYPTGSVRIWSLTYVRVDDPSSSVALGAFSWDLFDGAFTGDDWADFDTVMSGLSWDVFDRTDWSTV